MKIWVCPTKPPSTANGKYLMEKYPDRWELADNTTTEHHVHQLFEYFGGGPGDEDGLQVDCVVFNQLFGYPDAFWTDPDCEPIIYSNKEFFTKFIPANLDKSQNMDDVMFYYKKSKLLITGHHYEFSYCPCGHQNPPELAFEGGFMWSKAIPKMFFSPGDYRTFLPNMGRIRDPAIHAQQWQEVMKWDYEYATGHHDPPTVCGPIDDDEIMKDLKGYMKHQLEESGELYNDPQPGSWWPWKYSNGLYKLLAAEPGMCSALGNFIRGSDTPSYFTNLVLLGDLVARARKSHQLICFCLPFICRISQVIRKSMDRGRSNGLEAADTARTVTRRNKMFWLSSFHRSMLMSVARAYAFVFLL